jgi:peptide/nickel transport system permease protein
MACSGTRAPGHALSADTWQRFRRNRFALVGLVVVMLLGWRRRARRGSPRRSRQAESHREARAPGEKFLLGADEFGRDILSRIIYGSRVALLVGLLSVAIALGLGLLLGCLAGFAGGWLDVLIMRGVEILLAFPYLLLAIAVVSALGPGVLNTTIAVGIWGTPTVIRLVRGPCSRPGKRVRERGAGPRRHLGPRPHVSRAAEHPPHVIVYSTLFMANAILVEAALSFLGLGVPPPTPSWGLMVSSGRDFLLVAPHIATIPGLAIMVAVLGFNLLGDGLRDALDPRLRGQV